MREKSEHIFMFPFTWKYYDKKNTQVFSAHTHISKKIFNHLPNWNIYYQENQTDKDYNEFIYFYKPVRACLYSFKNEPIIVKNYIFRHLEQDSSVIIGVQGKEYKLSIKDISLKIYKTGIGILSISIMNDHYELPQDIMCINSFSKCIYPPVLPIKKAKEDLFPDFIRIKLNKNLETNEYFSHNYKNMPIYISTIIMDILGEPFVCSRKKVKKGIIYIEPVLGNQMFTLCIYKDSQFAKQITSEEPDSRLLENFVMINHKMVYHIKEFKNPEAWSIHYMKNDHGIYGISRVSLMCICNECLESKIYDRMVSIILMQRASLLGFSNEVARISALPKEIIIKAIQTIYEIYIQFMNQLYFKEVTEDIQGAQVYEKLAELLKIEEEFSQLGLEIEKIQEYATLIEQSSSQFRVQLITIVGAALIIPTFVTGFFGMDIFKDKIYHWWRHKEVILWLNGYVLLPMVITIGLCNFSKVRTKWSILKNGIILIVTLISLGIIFYYGTGL